MSINENTTALAELRQSFILPTMVDNGGFSSEDLAEEMDGLHLSFQRVKIPTGGALQFELPGEDPDHPDYAPTLTGVILYNHSSNAYWMPGSENEEDTTPLCSSVDGKMGYGDPGGYCADCRLNEFGSDGKGRGKACKNMRQIYLLRSGDFLPLQLTLSPTSIKPYKEFYNLNFALRRRRTCGSVVEIGLRRVDNKVNVYSVATFRKLFDFEGEQLAQALSIADSFKEQIKTMLQQRAVEDAKRPNDGLGNVDAYEVTGGEDSFVITGGSLDGEREKFPA